MISARRWFPATAVVVTVSLSSRHSSSYSYSYDICQLYWQDHSSSCSWHLDGSVLSLSEDSDEVVIIGETSAGFLWRCLRVVWIMFNEWLAYLSWLSSLTNWMIFTFLPSDKANNYFADGKSLRTKCGDEVQKKHFLIASWKATRLYRIINCYIVNQHEQSR